jgi:ubiquinone/menaquinone biosynthesis C-methylase UbiE
MGDEMRAYYDRGEEQHRLDGDGDALELVRTRELLLRYLPPAPAVVLDVGGGAGVYAAWLAQRGYRVHLVDPVPLHVEQARATAATQPEAPFTAALGDARRLAAADASTDAVLLFGPLYHLTERADRLTALREAGRVLRPGGRILAVGISRFASLLDGLRAAWLDDPAFIRIVAQDLRDGQHRNPERHPAWFTTAFFHHPDELAAEVEAAGLILDAMLGIEGPGWLLDAGWSDRTQREAILFAARAVEAEPSLRGLSAHLLAVAHRAD